MVKGSLFGSSRFQIPVRKCTCLAEVFVILFTASPCRYVPRYYFNSGATKPYHIILKLFTFYIFIQTLRNLQCYSCHQTELSFSWEITRCSGSQEFPVFIED
jgi:hypothetical protein